MKIALAGSILLNLVLSFFLFTRKPEKEIVETERLIIETHAEKAPEKNLEQTPEKRSKKEEKKKTDLAEISAFDAHDFQDAGERMEGDRQEFFTETLGLSDEKITRHNHLREEFFKKSSLLWQKNPMRELSFKERREMLQMEEEFHSKLEKLHGKKNWEKYQKFREDYNARGYKKQMEDGVPFLFMGI
jgi:hypothetical protein